MSNVSTILKQHAESLRLSSTEEVAVEHLKQAGYKESEARFQVAQHVMEKEAVSALTEKGVDAEEAVKLVKAANINLAELTSFSVTPEQDPTIELLHKAAEYVESLESQVEYLQDELTKQAEIRNEPEPTEQMNKIASAAQFTNEDLEELKRMSPEVLNKVAAAFDEPWSMGQGVGHPHQKSDPLLDFMLG